MSNNTKVFPLIAEPHPPEYDGYQFITLLRYNEKNYISIVDNVDNKEITAYILDYCDSINFPEERILQIAAHWYEKDCRHPISIEFSRLDVSEEISNIVRTFPVDYVTRVIGPMFKFPMEGPSKIKKRKRKRISSKWNFEDNFNK